MAFRPLSRRAALKGMGVSIALPFLEAMAPSVRAAVAAASSRPERQPKGRPLDVLDTSNRRPLHCRPVDALIQLLVYQANGADAVTTDQV